MDGEKFVKDRLCELNTPEVNRDMLKEKVLNSLSENNLRTNKKNYKIGFAIAACTVFILLTTTAVLANYNRIFDIFSRFLPHQEEYIDIPLDAEYTYKGITLRIEGVIKTDNFVRIIYSIHDELNRFDEYLSFMDFIGVRGAESVGGPIRGFLDEESGKVYRIIDAHSSSGFEQNLLEISIQRMFYDERRYEDKQFDIDLENLAIPNVLTNLDELFGDISFFPYDILEVDGFGFKLPIHGDVWISNIGVIENRLHVQIKTPSKPQDLGDYDGPLARCQPFLVDKDGEEIFVESQFRFTIYEGGVIDRFGDYRLREYYVDEYVFDLGSNSISDVELFFFVTTSNIVSGDWRVACDVNGIYDRIQSQPEGIVVGELAIEEININPLSITIRSRMLENFDQSYELESLEIVYKDGNLLEFDFFSAASYNWEDRMLHISFFSEDQLIAIDNIDFLRMDGVIIFGN